MNEYLYRHLVLLLLSYVAMLLFVLALALVGFVVVLVALILGTVLAFGVLSISD